MKLYFAGDSWNEVLIQAHRDKFNCLPRILKSYWYLKDNEREFNQCKTDDFFLDSGAFSAWTKNAQIKVEEYVDYVHSKPGRWSAVSCLDVIGDFRATMKNQAYMESRGVKALPVFHMSNPQESYMALERLCEEYEYFSLGGVAGANFGVKKKQAHLDKCFNIIGRYWRKGKKVKVHGFGVTNRTFVERYPFYSCDSTSWMSVARFGGAITFDGKLKTHKPASNGKHVQTSHISTAETAHRMYTSAVAYKKYEEYLSKLWTSRGFSWEN